jgi:hypothetical protein
MKHYLIPMAICLLSVISCNKADDPAPTTVDMMKNPETPEISPGTGQINKTGIFTSYAHNLMGSALFNIDSTNRRVLKLESFTMTQGPDVRVYIAKSNNYSKANVLEVTKLASGYSNQSLHFEITSSTYSEDYKFVLVYCLQYNSLFGYAELK